TFQGWDHDYGGGLVRNAVAAQLQYSVMLLDKSRCPRRLHADLYAAVGLLAHAAAFMAFDAYAHDDAQRMFRLALACAEESGAWHLRAKVLSSMARQSIWCGDADNGLTLCELALVRADRLTPAERAMILSARARALAKLGKVQETLETVKRADEEFARLRPDEEAPWMRYYDTAQHAGDTGHALFDLAIRGRPAADAVNRLADAVAGHTALYVRSRAISGIKLASLVMATGDPEEAASIGVRAVKNAGTVRSRRAQDDMRELHRLARPHANREQVTKLRHPIQSAIQTCHPPMTPKQRPGRSLRSPPAVPASPRAGPSWCDSVRTLFTASRAGSSPASPAPARASPQPVRSPSPDGWKPTRCPPSRRCPASRSRSRSTGGP